MTTNLPWNYRILAHTNNDKTVSFGINPVYYKNFMPHSYGQAVIMASVSIEDFWEMVEATGLCIKNPILWAGDKFPNACKLLVKPTNDKRRTNSSKRRKRIHTSL